MSSSPPHSDPRRRRIRLPWSVLPVSVRDAAGGVVLFVLSLLPLGVAGVELGELQNDVAAWVPPTLIAGQTLALVLRHTAPAIALAVVGAAFAAAQLAGVATGIAGLGLFVVIYSFAAYQRRNRRVIAVAAAAGYVLLAVALHAEGSPERPIDWATFFVVLGTPWLVGLLVRRRLAEQAAREAVAAETAVRDSRTALARDLHDIVTHHVTAIVVQADSAAYLDAADVAERTRTLDNIAGTGRRALQELRSLLGALEQSSPAALREPLTRSVADLVAEAQAHGYPVTLDAAPNLTAPSDAVAVTLYRIAQEALTNAMKHAPGTPVTMTLTERDGRLDLQVINDVVEQNPGLPGRGRRGMADRAALLEGTVETGVTDGRFRVLATMPVDAEAGR